MEVDEEVRSDDALKSSTTVPVTAAVNDDFSVRYYAGHRGKFGHEFFEFEISFDPKSDVATLYYANNSNYRDESLIQKEAMVSPSVVKELKRIIDESEIVRESDEQWPEKNRDGKQELEIVLGKQHVNFETCRISSFQDVQKSKDPEGFEVFYYLVQDLKAMVLSLVSLHFKIKPI